MVYNVANFTKPAPGQPALLTLRRRDDDVPRVRPRAARDVLAACSIRRLSGTNVPRDFVEFPSQFNEHWALEPTVFANYAKHYQTGAPMPAALVDKIKQSRTFNQGFATTEYLGASLLDFAWHTLPAGARPAGRRRVRGGMRSSASTSTCPKFRRAIARPTSRTSGTAAIAAGYYAYTWSEVLDDDAYAWFNGARRTDARERSAIPGHDLVAWRHRDAATLYRNFRGRDPSVDALLIERGLKVGFVDEIAESEESSVSYGGRSLKATLLYSIASLATRY